MSLLRLGCKKVASALNILSPSLLDLSPWGKSAAESAYGGTGQSYGKVPVARDQDLSMSTWMRPERISLPQAEPLKEIAAPTNSLTATAWETLRTRGTQLSHAWIPEP